MRFMSEDDKPTVMATDELVDETAVSDRYAVTIPSAVRDRLDVEPGDRIRWRVTESKDLVVEVLKQRTGVFDDFEPVDMGETHAADDHDLDAVESRDR